MERYFINKNKIEFCLDIDDIEWRKIIINNKKTKYSISNIGVVRNDNTNKYLKSRFIKGYEVVRLQVKKKNKQFFVHRLVALAFIPNINSKPEVNHKDGDKSNNYVWNLEWVTAQENCQHTYDTGLNKSDITYDRIKDKKIREICELLEQNELTIAQIAKTVGVGRSTVGNILHKKSHTDISSQYNIDNYEIKTDFSYFGDDNKSTIYPDTLIHEVCKLLDSNKYTLKEISNISGVPYQIIRNIYYKVNRTDISSQYNFYNLGPNPVTENKIPVVKKICELLDSGLNTKEVSEQVGVGRGMVRCILSGNSWKEISKDYNFIKNKMTG